MTERGYQLLQSTVERLLRRNATTHLTNILNKTHPADIAYLLKLLNERSSHTLFEFLPNIEIAAEVLSEMEAGFRIEFGALSRLGNKLVQSLRAQGIHERAERTMQAADRRCDSQDCRASQRPLRRACHHLDCALRA